MTSQAQLNNLESYSQYDPHRNEKNILWKAKAKYYIFCITNILLLSLAIRKEVWESKFSKSVFKKPYHLQQEPCATGLWLLVQQHSQQKEPCYSFYLLR